MCGDSGWEARASYSDKVGWGSEETDLWEVTVEAGQVGGDTDD